MERLFLIEPEVAGSWGPQTVVTNRAQLESGAAKVPEVAHLEYRFEVWLGDELLMASPCYIVTEDLAQSIRGAHLTGAHFDEVEITTSDEWRRWAHNIQLPAFERLIPDGVVEFRTGGDILRWSGDDLCMGTRVDYVKPKQVELIGTTPGPYGLVVTERCYRVLQQHRLDHSEVEELGKT
jgi:hypothetical protein